MRLFISYARIDRVIVEDWIVNKLRSGGHEVWFDDQLLAGLDWKDQLASEIKRSDGLVYAMTPESIQSEWCRWEVAKAVELGRFIIPVLLQERTNLPDELNHLHYVDFSKGATGDAVARLLGGIQRVTPNQIPEPPTNPAGLPAQAARTPKTDIPAKRGFTVVIVGIAILILALVSIAVLLSNQARNSSVSRQSVITSTNLDQLRLVDWIGLGKPTRIAFSPNGRTMAVGTNTGIQLIDVTDPSNEEQMKASIRILDDPGKGHERYISALAFSPDGTMLVSGSSDGHFILWNLLTGQALTQPIQITNAGSLGLQGFVFSPDTKYLLTIGCVEFAIWDVGNPAQPTELTNQARDRDCSGVFSVNPTQSMIASYGESGVRLWRLDFSNQQIQPLDDSKYEALSTIGDVDSLAFSPDGHVLASGDGNDSAENPAIRFWDVDSGQQINEVTYTRDDSIAAISYSPDGRFLFSMTYGEPMLVWDMATFKLVKELEPVPTYSRIAVDPQNQRIATIGWAIFDTRLQFFNTSTLASIGETITIYDLMSSDFAVSPDNSSLAISYWDGRASFRTMESDTEVFLGKGQIIHPDTALAVAYNPVDSLQLASGGDGGTVKLWNLTGETPQEMGLLEASNNIYCLAYSPNGTLILVGYSDNQIRLFSAVDAKEITDVPQTKFTLPVHDVAFNPDGTMFAAGSQDGKVKIWQKSAQDSWQYLDQYEHEGAVKVLAFSPDGEYLASGGEDDVIRLWSASTKTLGSEPLRHDQTVEGLAFSPDGNLLASAVGNRFVFWDLKYIPQPKMVHAIVNEDTVGKIDFSHDGMLFLGIVQGTVKILGFSASATG